MKNASKNNKFSSCFRPVVDIDAMLDSGPAVHRPSSRRFSCVPVPVPHKHHIKISDTKSVFLDKVCPKYPEDSVTHHPPKEKRTPFLVMKAVVFHTILNKRGKRVSGNGSKGSYSAQAWEDGKGQEAKSESPLSGSGLRGSSPILESQNSSESDSREAKKKEKESENGGTSEKQKRLGWLGIYLLLVSLTFTVLRDKYWGVVLTSTCLYLFCVCEARHRNRIGKPIRDGAQPQMSKKESELSKNRGHNGRSAREELP